MPPDAENESQTIRVQKDKPQRGVIRKPRATPWEQIGKHVGALKGRNKSGGADGSADARPCETGSTALQWREVARDTRLILTAVRLGEGYRVVMREQRGDRQSLCPDCNEMDLPFCGECRRDTLLVQMLDGSGAASGEVVEIDSWYPPGAGYISEVAAAVTPDGTAVLAWGRNFGGSAKLSDVMVVPLDAAGTPLAISVQVDEQRAGDVHLVAHPRRPRVLLYRDSVVLLRHLGVRARVLGVDGRAVTDWLDLGSSLAYEAGVGAFRDGFVVAFSDQAPDAQEPDCEPCTSIEECFGSDPTMPEDDPSPGCHSFLDATEAGGLQLALVDEVGASRPLVVRSGWYDDWHQGEPIRLYTDHYDNQVIETGAGLLIASEYTNWPESRMELHLVALDLDHGASMDTLLPYRQEDGDLSWFAWLTHAGEPILLAGLLDGFDETPDGFVVRAYGLGTEGCMEVVDTIHHVIQQPGDYAGSRAWFSGSADTSPSVSYLLSEKAPDAERIYLLNEIAE